jgi:hypothetical protein
MKKLPTRLKAKPVLHLAIDGANAVADTVAGVARTGTSKNQFLLVLGKIRYRELPSHRP